MRPGTVAASTRRVTSYLCSDVNSYCSSDLSSPLYGLVYPTLAATGDVATVGDGADSVIRGYCINRAGNAVSNGIRSAHFLNASGTSLTMSFRARTLAGASTPISIQWGMLDAAGSAWLAGGPYTISVTSTFQTFTHAAFTGLTEGAEYRVAFAVNAISAQQARVIVDSLIVSPNNGTGIFGSSFTRYDLPPTELYDHGRSSSWVGLDATFRLMRGPALARARFKSSAGACVVEYASIYQSVGGVQTTNEPQSIIENGSLNLSITTETQNTILQASTTLTGGVCDLVGGGSIYERTAAWRAVYLPGVPSAIKIVPPTTFSIQVWGDSLTASFYANTASFNSWISVARRLLRTPIVAEGSGARTLYDVAGDGTKRSATVTTMMQAGTGSVIVILLGTNDWGGIGGAIWAASDYGIGLAALVDLIHTTDPTATVILCSSFFHRSGEASNNTFGAGSNLAGYAGQCVIVQSTRTSYVKLLDIQTNVLTTTPAFGDGIHFDSTADCLIVGTNFAAQMRSLVGAS